MADDGKLDRLWDHLDERLAKLEALLTRERLKEVIKEAISESNTIKELSSRIAK